MKRYYYIVWRRQFDHRTIQHEVIDCSPGDWLVKNIKAFLKREAPGDGLVVIINQFEITAEQYQALESLQ